MGTTPSEDADVPFQGALDASLGVTDPLETRVDATSEWMVSTRDKV